MSQLGRQRLSVHCNSEHFADTWSALTANVRYSPESRHSDGSNLDARMTAMWLCGYDRTLSMSPCAAAIATQQTIAAVASATSTASGLLPGGPPVRQSDPFSPAA